MSGLFAENLVEQTCETRFFGLSQGLCTDNKTSFYLAIKYVVNNKFVIFSKKCYNGLTIVFLSYSEFRCIFLQIELWIRFFNPFLNRRKIQTVM
jgi:hypothetical protein